MSALLSSVFIASILGSLHCAGMCGPFAWMAAISGSGVRKSPGPALAGYHGSRLVLYACLGGMAGAFGLLVDWGSTTAGWQRGAAWLGGSSMILFALLRLIGGHRWLAGSKALGWLLGPLSRWMAQTKSMTGWRRGALIGGVSGLMPCGWLYAFVLAAGATGSPWKGTVLMIVFWFGSVPILGLVASGMGSLSRPLAARAPALMACAVFLIGIFTLSTRGSINGCSQASPARIDDPEGYVRSIDQEALPCCRPEGAQK
jgi:hypothetical protein